MSDSGKHADGEKLGEDIGDAFIESDIELDESAVVEPDNDPPQKMGDPTIEVTDDMLESAQAEKVKAVDAMSEGKLDEALDHLTEAVLLNPTSAILYATRAGIFVKLKKPNAALRDADAALKINPDSAKGYKARGMARAMLGHWVEALKDLHMASNLDFDDEIASVLKMVEPNAQKIEHHRRKSERLQKELELHLHFRPLWQVIGIHSARELESKLQAATRTSRLAVLYFTATWCGPCRFICPLFTSLAAKHPKVVFLKADIDEAGDMAASWNVSSVPAFHFIRNGKEIDKVVGADKNGLETKLQQYGG